MIYGGNHLDDLQEIVDRTVKDLRKEADHFDYIAVRGCSGLVVGSPVALKLNKPLVIIRKPDEKHHSYGQTLINIRHSFGRYVFLDDFICSGATRDSVVVALNNRGEYVGAYLYNLGMDDRAGWYEGRRPSKHVSAELQEAA